MTTLSSPNIKPADQQTAKPQPGEERTGPQNRMHFGGGGFWGDLGGWGIGGECLFPADNSGRGLPPWSNPCGYPNYGGISAYDHGYHTYRWMLQHPVVQMARSVVTKRIIGNPLNIEPREKGNDQQEKLAKDLTDQLAPLWRQHKKDRLRALDYGWAGFEKIWDIKDGRRMMRRLKYLLVDITLIQVDDHGNYAGIKQSPTYARGTTAPDAWDGYLDVHESCIHTNDAEAGNLHGRSRLENIRQTAWRDWLLANTELERLGQNISGMKLVAKVPPGQFTDSRTGQVKYFRDDIAQQMAYLHNGGYALVLPSLVVQAPIRKDGSSPMPDPELIAKLASASLIDLSMLDFGPLTPGIVGLLSRMQHDEELIFQGWLQSPRVGMESKHGSRADAEQHTDTGIADSEEVQADIDEQFNHDVLDDILWANNLEPGIVQVKSPPLIDERITTLREFVKSMIANPNGIKEVMAHADLPTIFGLLNVPAKDKPEVFVDPTAPVVPPPGTPPGAESGTPPPTDQPPKQTPTQQKQAA